MKKLLLIAFAVVCAIAFTQTAHAEKVADESPIPSLNHLATDELVMRFMGVGYTRSNFKQPIGCAVNGAGNVECLFKLRQYNPPTSYDFYWCEGHNDDWGYKDRQAGCVYFKQLDGDQSCSYLLKQGMTRSEVAQSSCVWGTRHLYYIKVVINAGGQAEVEVTHERELDPETGKPYVDATTGRGRYLSQECAEAMRDPEYVKKYGRYGTGPACAGHDLRKPCNNCPLERVD